jgi:hypothetical protein
MGKEKIAGADAYHLKVTLKNGDVREFYLDAGTFLVSKAVVKSMMRGTQVEIESTIGDYRKVEGLMFPFSIQQHAVGGEGAAQKITLKKIEVNVPVEDSLFKMPPAAPAPAPAKTGPAPK